MDLSKFTTPKINYLRENLNLTEDEEIVFDMLAKGKSRVEIAMKANISKRCVDYKVAKLKAKMKDLEEME